MTTEEMTVADVVREALRENVIDPEIGENVVDLGLVYDIAVENGMAEITMTLTTPACPLGPLLEQEVHAAVDGLPGVEGVTINLVWTPPWDPSMMSEDAKLNLGFW